MWKGEVSTNMRGISCGDRAHDSFPLSKKCSIRLEQAGLGYISLDSVS